MAEPRARLGFIGLGVMGAPMAGHLLAAEFQVTVLDTNQERLAQAITRGATVAASPREVAQASDAVICMLPMPSDTETVIFGDEGVAAGLAAGGTVIDMSTNSPRFAKSAADRLEAAGLAFLEAPVTLGEPAARLGSLTIMVAGRELVYLRHLEMLRAMGEKIVYVGAAGRAQLAKLVSNVVALATLAAFSEGFVLAAKNGIDPEMMYDILTHSIGDSRELRHAGSRILAGEFEVGFALDLALKDLDLALATGRDCAVPLPVSTSVRELFSEAQACGLGDKDCRAVIQVLEAASGVRVRAGHRPVQEPVPQTVKAQGAQP
jgi:2-hydroxy-3-oxopropionate reductase